MGILVIRGYFIDLIGYYSCFYMVGCRVEVYEELISD